MKLQRGEILFCPKDRRSETFKHVMLVLEPNEEDIMESRVVHLQKNKQNPEKSPWVMETLKGTGLDAVATNSSIATEEQVIRALKFIENNPTMDYGCQSNCQTLLTMMGLPLMNQGSNIILIGIPSLMVFTSVLANNPPQKKWIGAALLATGLVWWINKYMYSSAILLK